MIVQTQQLTPSADRPSARMGATAAQANASISPLGMMMFSLPFALAFVGVAWVSTSAPNKRLKAGERK